MKFILLFGAFALPAFSEVIEPVNLKGHIFGLVPGVYKGIGVLNSRPRFVPDVEFISVRTIKNGIIFADTKIKYWGHVVGEAKARLRVVTTGAYDGEFALLDLDHAGKKIGQGQCNQNECHFSAKIMCGLLQLNETWRVNGDEFELIDGTQRFAGVVSDYRGEFRLLERDTNPR